MLVNAKKKTKKTKTNKQTINLYIKNIEYTSRIVYQSVFTINYKPLSGFELLSL